MGNSVAGKARIIALLIGLMFIAFAMIPAYICVTTGFHSLNMVQSGVPATGAVVDYVPVPYASGPKRSSRIHYMPLVRFQTGTGEEIEFIELNHKLPKDNYPVLYLEDNPRTAVVDDFLTLWKWPLVSAITALLLFLIGAGVVLRSRRIGY